MPIQAGDILLFKAEKDFLSKIIAWGTNSKYSHVAICVSPEMNLAMRPLSWGEIWILCLMWMRQTLPPPEILLRV